MLHQKHETLNEAQVNGSGPRHVSDPLLATLLGSWSPPPAGRWLPTAGGVSYDVIMVGATTTGVSQLVVGDSGQDTVQKTACSG